MSVQKRIIVLLFNILLIQTLNAQYKDIQVDYFGQTPPGDNAVVFAPGFISRDGWRILNSCFSPDGKEFVFNIFNPGITYAYTMYTKYSDGKWTEPDTLFDNYRVKNFSLDGNSLYLVSPKGMNGPTGDIFVSTRENGVWKKPVDLGFPINSNNGNELEICQAANGNLYFSSSRPGGYGDMDIYRAELVNGKYEKAVNLGFPINTASLDECPYIAPDESFMIFNSWKSNPKFGTNNLYITYRKKDSSWTFPKDLGASVNTNERDVYPYITPDGKYLLYTIYNYGTNSVGKIYWRNANFIDSLKHTNFAPYCRKSIPGAVAAAGSPFSYQIPDSVFIDDDENDTLLYTVSNMPSWMSFDPAAKTFTGTPAAEANPVSVIVTVTDSAKSSASTKFSITVKGATDIERKDDSSINEFNLNQNYPNPFNPETVISYRLSGMSKVELKVYDLLGKEIGTLVNGEQTAGKYDVKFSGTNLPSGIYFIKLQAGNYMEVKKMMLVK